MPRKYVTLETWISEAISDQEKVDTTTGEVRPCTAMAVLHLSGNGSGTREVDAIRLAGRTWDPAQIAKRFQRKMEAQCQDLGGIQSFVVQAFYNQQEPEATHPVRCVDGEMTAGDDWRVNEGPTEKGILAQMMRHTEHKDQMLMAMIRATVGGWADERHKLQSEVNDAYAIVRELMMKQADNSHAYAMQQLQFQRSTDERKTLMAMAPAVVNGLTGREIFPKADQDSAIIDAFARRVKPEQLDMLVQMGAIPKELHAPLLARFSETLARDQEERAEVRRAPPANIDPSQDAQGN